MAETGKLAAWMGYGKPFEIREYPVPDPEPGAVVIKVAIANVCGSDMHYWKGEQDYEKMGRPLPLNTGHEHMGTVHKLGPGVTTDSTGIPLREGDRVVYRYFNPCGHCRACLNCAFTQVYAGLEIAGMRAGQTVAIQGAGGLGIYACAVAREMGAARVIVIDGFDERLELASEFGADEFVDLREYRSPTERIERVRALCDNWGGDVVMELVGNPAVVEEGLKMTAPEGTYLEIGNINVGWEATFDPAWIVFGNRKIQGVAHYEADHLKGALDLMTRTLRKYPYHKVLSHKFPLDQINEAFTQQVEGHITRAAIVPN